MNDALSKHDYYLLELEAATWIADNEHLRLLPYRCPSGALSIGYGRNLDAQGITAREAIYLLRNDISEVHKSLSELYWYNIQPRGVKKALINMAFNLGIPKLMKFEKMIGALRRHDFERAAKEALNSLWAKQVGNRANEIAGVIRQGK